MPYLLYHHFDPTFDHQNLKPGLAVGKGKVDHYNLGYVQNVVKGQVLAEFIPIDDTDDPVIDRNHIFEEPLLPVGPNCKVDPDSPLRVVADANGYVFYNDGLITVKRMLNVRRDVDFHTGNIFFVSDIAVHGDVRAGFEVQGNNILVKGIIEGATVRARGSLAVEGGARGSGGSGLLDAGDTLRVPFAESMELRAHGNILIEKFCLHSLVYAATNLVVKNRLQGGTVHCNGLVYVETHLGNPKGTPTATRINMGYDPFTMRKLDRLEQHIRELQDSLTHIAGIAGNLGSDSAPGKRLDNARKKLNRLIRQREALWAALTEDEARATLCRVVVPGTVYPGVEISIGKAFFEVEHEMNNVSFSLADGSIVVTSPAIIKKKA
ncbi:MAG TPA: DUF342 domain-containing protein [Desulfovibrio sp.]|nr:DUF342 domain-containing protein [Desulfovibrio sp.]